MSTSSLVQINILNLEIPIVHSVVILTIILNLVKSNLYISPKEITNIPQLQFKKNCIRK